MAKSTSPSNPGRTLLRNIKPISVTNLGLAAADTKISATDKSLIDERLNEVLRQRIKDALASSGETVLKKIDTIKIDYQSATELGLTDYLQQQILPQLEKEAGPRAFLLKPIAGADEKISDVLNLGMPLKKNPHFADEIRVTRINEYGSLAGLKSDKLSKIVELNTDPSLFDMEHYEKLLADQIITQKEKKDLQLVFELGKLSDDNFSLVGSLKSTSIQSPRELAGWEQNDWVDFIKKEKISIPQEETIEAYVENIITNLSQSFPSYRLLSRIPKKLDEGLSQWNTITPLLKYNPKLLSSGTDVEIDWKGITQRERQTIETGLGDIRGFMKGFRHLDVDKILADEATNIDTKQQLVQQKMQQLTSFIKNNADIDLTTADFFNKEETRKMNWNDIPEGDQKKIRNQMMAYQRTISLAGPEHAEKLVMKGFDSASDISELQFEDFKIQSGLPLAMAKKTYSLANETTMATTHAFEAARSSIKDTVGNGLHVSNWDLPDYTNQLKELDGFDDLFGSQDYCNCEHCRSIFSPAAYFVDLMYFVEKNVSDKVFKTRKNHALYLKNRRPDLWSLKLTCENTNTLIPYLDVVNEVLEAYLKRSLSITDVYKRLHTEQVSFNLPFNLYLEEIRIYLTHFSTTLFDIFKTLKNSNDEIWRERIKLNPEEWQVIITPDANNNVRKRIGDPLAASFAKFDVKEFIRFAGITRSQLDDLLDIKFSKQLKTIVIVKEQSTDPLTDPLINYVEKITNLTNERLDFMHRFIRLWRKTGWTIREFDLLLTTLKENGLVNATANADKNGIIDKEAIIQCARLLELQEKMKLKTEEIPALYGELTAKTVYDNKADFFTRTFNAQLLGSASSISFHHSFVNNDGVADPKLGFLLGGLGIAEGELVQLFGLLDTVIVFDGSGNTTLNREKISLLYRHARIAKALKLTVEEFILVLQLLFAGGTAWIDSIDQLFTLYSFKQKLQSLRLKITDCWFILKGEEKGAAGYKISPDQSYSLVWNLQLQKTIYFDPALLADIIDVGADNSVKIIEEMVVEGLAVKKSLTEDLYRLTPAYLLTQNFATVFTAIAAMAPVIAKANDIRAKFNQLHAKNILQQNMAKLLNITITSFDNLLPFITIPLADTSMYTALYTSFDDKGVPLAAADLLPVVNLAKQFEKILYLFSKTNLKDEDILFVANNNSIFGIADPTLLSFDHIVNLAEYRKLVSINLEKRDKIQLLLQHYQSASVFSNEEFVLLAEFWKLDKNLLESVATFIPLPATTMEAIAYLLECLALCKTLGINGESLNKFTETDFTKLEKIRDIIIGVFASKYPDEDERTKKMEPYHDKVNTKKRDALCDFIIAHIKELKFKDLHDLYAYFLLDVEMSGCFRTSRVVAAISSVKLYVFRCLMNLEQAAFAT
ncbi:MAG: neuraminidase-like domain-containing protein, partial [Chitinophagaceae bacterium]